MTTQPEALRLADELLKPVGTQSTYSAMQDAAAELCRLHAEVEALRTDAERYRWLRDFSANQWVFPLVVHQERVALNDGGEGMRYIGPLTGKTLDTAIDAARSET